MEDLTPKKLKEMSLQELLESLLLNDNVTQEKTEIIRASLAELKGRLAQLEQNQRQPSQQPTQGQARREMTAEEKQAMIAKYLPTIKASKAEPKITGYGVFTVNGTEYSAENIELSWSGRQTWTGLVTAKRWTVTFPDGTRLTFDPRKDIAKDGSREVLEQCAFPD